MVKNDIIKRTSGDDSTINKTIVGDGLQGPGILQEVDILGVVLTFMELWSFSAKKAGVFQAHFTAYQRKI